MPIGAGWSSWPVNAFDAFSDVPLSKVAMVFPVLSAATADTRGCEVNWNTWNGNNKIDIYTPVTQDVFFNMAVIWAVG